MIRFHRTPLQKLFLACFLLQAVLLQNGFLKSLDSISAEVGSDRGTIEFGYTINYTYYLGWVLPTEALVQAGIGVEAKTGTTVLDFTIAGGELSFNSLAWPNGSLPVSVSATWDPTPFGPVHQVSTSLSVAINNPDTSNPCVAFVNLIPGFGSPVGPDLEGVVQYRDWDIQIFFIVRPGCGRTIVRGPSRVELKERLPGGELGKTVCTAPLDPEDDELNPPCTFNLKDVSQEAVSFEAQYLCSDLQVCGRELLASQSVAIPSFSRPQVTPTFPPPGFVLGASDPKTVTFTAAITDAAGDLVSARFLVNGLIKGVASISGSSVSVSFPYEFVAHGNYTIEIEALDSFGYTGKGTWKLTVEAGLPPPEDIPPPTPPPTRRPKKDGTQGDDDDHDGEDGDALDEPEPEPDGLPDPEDGGPECEERDEEEADPNRCADAIARGVAAALPNTVDDVVPSTGEATVRENDAYYAQPGPDFTFDRTYRSNSSESPGILGPGWSNGFEGDVQVASDGLYETDGRGTTRHFPSDGQGGFQPETYTHATAAMSSDGQSIRVTRQSGTSFDYSASTGKLMAIEDRNGNGFSLAYSADTGSLQTITDSVGRTTNLQVQDGRLTSMTLPDGSQTAYGYTNGMLTSATIAGRTTTYQYRPSDQRLVSRANAAGESRSWSYDADQRVASQTHESGAVTNFAYQLQPSGVLTTVTNSLGAAWALSTDTDGFPTEVQKPDGSTWTTTYASQDHRVVQKMDPDGRVTTYTRDPISGLLTRIQDPLGNSTVLERDPSTSKVIRRIEPDGTIYQAQVDLKGNLLTLTDPAGTTTFTRNAVGQATSIQKPTGEVTTFQRNALGDVSRVTNALGASTLIQSDILGRVQSLTDPLGRTTSYQYLAGTQLPTQVQDPLGQITTIAYNSVLRPASVTVPGGAQTLLTWQTFGSPPLLVQVRDALLGVTRIRYDGEGHPTEIEDPLGRVRRTEWTLGGLPQRFIDPRGAITEFGWGPDETLRTILDPLQNETTLEYDTARRLIRSTDPEGQTTHFEWTPRGRLRAIVSPLGKRTEFEFTARGDLSRVRSPMGHITRITRDPVGRILSVTDPRGSVTTYHRDLLGRVTRVVAADGGETHYTWNTADELVSVQDPEGRLTTLVRDGLGRVIRVTGPSGETTLMSYTPTGAVASVTDPDGRISTIVRDLLDRPTVLRDPLGHEVRLTWDAASQLRKLTDERSHDWAMEYDPAGNLVRQVDPLGRASSRQFDLAGRLLSVLTQSGNTLGFDWDRTGRLTRRTRPEGEDRLTWDADGLLRLAGSRRAGETEDWIQTLLTWDDDSRLVSVLDSRGFSATHTLDPSGNPIATEDSHGRTLQRVFDPLGRLTRLEAPHGRSLDLVYDRSGLELERTFSTGISASRTYDASGRLDRIEYRKRHRHQSKLLAAFSYRYSQAGDVLREIEERRGEPRLVTSYTYTPRHELAMAKLDSGSKGLRGFRSMEFRRDPSGNLLERIQDHERQLATFDAANQLLTIDGRDAEHDDDGNLAREPLSGTEDRVYLHDSLGRLVETWVEKRPAHPHGGHGPRGPPGHHGHGHKHRGDKDCDDDDDRHGHRHDDDDEERRCHTDHWEGRHHGPRHDPDPSPCDDKAERFDLRRFHYGPEGLEVQVEAFAGKSRRRSDSERIDRFWVDGAVFEDRSSRPGKDDHHAHHRLFPGDGALPAFALHAKTTGHRFREHESQDDLYLQDLLGSTRAVAGKEDDLRFVQYLPDGVPAGDQGELPAFAFTGHLSEDLGRPGEALYSAPLRHLRPGLGRWTSLDPLGFIDGSNLYAYARGNPTSYRDPSGGFLPAAAGGLLFNEFVIGPLISGAIAAKLNTDACKSTMEAFVGGAYDAFTNPFGLRSLSNIVRDVAEDKTPSFWDVLDVALNALNLSGGLRPQSAVPSPPSTPPRSALPGPIADPSRLLETARDQFLRRVADPDLRKRIDALYRATARYGNGGTADALRHEWVTGQLLSPSGHYLKVQQMINGLYSDLLGGRLSRPDADLAREVLQDLQRSLNRNIDDLQRYLRGL